MSKPKSTSSPPASLNKESSTEKLSIRFSIESIDMIQFNDDEVSVARFNCIQSWFLAASSVEKENFVYALVDRINSNGSLLILLKVLDSRRDKTNAYLMSHQTTNCVYDKNLQDHNRGLQKSYLKVTVKEDLDWFDTLNETKQIDVIFELLKIGGGAIVRNVFYKTLSVYRQRKMTKAEETVEANKETYEGLVQPYNPKDVHSIEVQKATKKWNDTLNKYQVQVEGRRPEKKENVKKKKKSSKKSSAKSKSTKSTKSKSTKSKEKSDQSQFMIDQVQLLPIWIVKQIFSYLDPKTLQKIKKVNSYWAYVAADMLKERTTRKYIDKTITKLQIDTDCIDMEENKLQSKRNRISALDKRLYRLSCRGAVHPKLQLIDTAHTYQHSLLTETVHENKSKYKTPVAKLQTFPRNVFAVDDSVQAHPSEDEVIEARARTPTLSFCDEVSSDSMVCNVSSLT